MDPGVDWVSVSGLLDAASNELEVGQLLHTSVFSLFESMSAVEIGNPKMDAGARPKGNTTPLEQREMKLDLTPEQLLGIMDHLLCLEATWHSGGALPCTLYSSIYMMQPDRTASNVLLSAYCRATEALCAEVNQLIMTGCVCEEEDFNAHIAGLPLEHATTAAGAAATGATPAPQHCSSNIEKLLALMSNAIDAQEAASKQQQQQQQQSGAAAAIVARLQFRKLLLQALIKIKRRQKQDLDQAAKLLLKAQTELAAVKDSIEFGREHAGLGFDEDMNSHLVPAVPPRAVKVFSPDQAVEYFESLLGQLLRVCHITQVSSYRALKDYLLAFTTQPICALSRSAMHIQVSYNIWNPQQQQQQHAAAPAAAGSSSSSNTYDEKHHQHHIASPKHAPGAAAAAVNGTAAVADGSTTAPHSSSSSSSVAVPHWCLSPAMIKAALQLSQDEELGDDGELFLEQAVIATSNVIQALLMNRSRCRRRLRRGLEDWGNLYQHALNADNSPQFQAYMAVHGWSWKNDHPADLAGPLSTWVESETCFSMVTHLLMGFELSLYEPADYSMIYWYVDLLCMVWQQGSRLLQEQQPALVTLPIRSSSSSSSKSAAGLGGAKLPSKSGGKSNAKSNSHKSPGKHVHQSAAAAPASPAAAAAGGPTKEDYLLLNLMLEIRRNLSMGLLRTMMSLQMLGMYQAPELPFNSAAQRFDQRFASFSLLMRPDPLSYEQYVSSTNVEGVSVGQLLTRAAESFKRAQQASAFLKTQVSSLNPNKQQLAEAAAAERVAATNAVAATLLSRAAGSSSNKSEEAAAAAAPQFKPHFEFGLSKMFPTLTLKSAAAK